MSDSGVVDPIRIPPWLREPAERWWREMPPLARAFVGLAALDVLGRSIGFLPPAIRWSYLTPLGFIAAYLPHDLWILLPALLLIRRPDAATATPWVLRGAVLVAVVEVARAPVRTVLEWPGGPSAISELTLGLGSLGLLVAWVLLAHGLRALTPRDPSQTVAGIANLAAGALGILAALYLAEVLVAPPVDLNDPALDQAITLDSLVATAQVLGWAFLVWVVIRGLGDRRRPASATNLAAAGALLAGFVVPVLAVVGRVSGALGFNPNDGSGIGEVYLIIGWLGDVAGPALIAAAFALGLAEPAMPYLAPTEPVGPSDTFEAPSEAEPGSAAEPAASGTALGSAAEAAPSAAEPAAGADSASEADPGSQADPAAGTAEAPSAT